MKEHYTIKNIPIPFPITSTILHLFLLHYFEVNKFIWFGYGLGCLIYWIAIIIYRKKQISVDITEVLKK